MLYSSMHTDGYEMDGCFPFQMFLTITGLWAVVVPTFLGTSHLSHSSAFEREGRLDVLSSGFSSNQGVELHIYQISALCVMGKSTYIFSIPVN